MTDFGYKFKLRKGTDKQTQCQECETMDTFRWVFLGKSLWEPDKKQQQQLTSASG